MTTATFTLLWTTYSNTLEGIVSKSMVFPSRPTSRRLERIVVGVGELLGIEDSKEHGISIAHRLPPTKKVQDRIIAKFIRRDMGDKFYSSRGKLIGKSAKDIPLISETLGTNNAEDSKIFINESLTLYRRRLFGRVNEYKRNNKRKHIWTVNGKIYLRQSDESKVLSFTTSDEFDEFLGH